MARRVALLGATGSIGRQTLEVLRGHREEFTLVSVAAARRLDELADIAREFAVTHIGVAREEDRAMMAGKLAGRADVVAGPAGLAQLAREADIVVNAVVGFAGLPVTLAALAAGKRLALANKESFIAAAPLVERVRATPGAEVVPLDSEHCAIHQCLAGSSAPGHPDVRALWLTASGGPFRGWTRDRLAEATRQDALHHPTWSMGPKITVDSSTLMNKGFEVLEASALFGIEVDRVKVVVHPQSIVHSMVEYVDGSLLAQLARPDMRLPIAYGLGYPERLADGWGALDLTQRLSLTFEPPDVEAFPAIPLAYAAARAGGAAAAWLSGANEVAVDAFLAGRLRWSEIVPVVATVMDGFVDGPMREVADVVAHDAAARDRAARAITVHS